MNLNASFPGETIRFEGHRTVVLRQLPAGAQIQSARVTVTPKAPPGAPDRLFEEVLIFPAGGPLGDFGMTRVVAPGGGPVLGTVEVDFHARRTLAAVQGTNTTGSGSIAGAVLLVDLGGGVFMPIAQNGALATPDNTDPFNVPAGGALPGLTVAKFRLQAAAAAPPEQVQVLNVSQVTIRTVPTNVSVALEGLAPFWTRLGEMTAAETSDDFAQFLQLYLNDAEVVGGFYEIPLVVHSDTLARLDLAVAIEYVVQQSALPAGVGEVALPYGHDTVPQDGCAALQVALPPGAQVTSAAVRVLGSFESSRVAVGPTGPVAPTAMAAVRPDQGQAQPIRLARVVPATAIDLLLSCVSQAAVLEVNVLGDVDGKPFGDALLPRPVRIELARDIAPAPTWLSAELPEAFQFPAGRVWLAVQAREGQAVWHAVAAAAAVAEADPIGLHYSAASGLTWRASRGERAGAAPVNGAGDEALAGLFRLRHVPPEYRVPLEVLVGQGDGATRVSLDRYRALGRIDFTIDFPEFVAAINRAARAGEGSGAPQGEQLRNGDFARWTVAGDRIGAPQRVPGIDIATTVSIPAHGQWAYVGEIPRTRQAEFAARFLDLPEHTGDMDPALPMPMRRQEVAIRSDGERIAVMMASEANETRELFLVDGRARRVLASSDLDLALFCLAWSPDQHFLYSGALSGEAGEVQVIEAEALEQLMIRGEVGAIRTLLSHNSFTLSDGFLPISLALSADGRRLFVAALQQGNTAAASSSRIYGFDTRTHSPLRGSPLDVPGRVVDLALTPDGGTLLAVNVTRQALQAVDATRLTLARTIPLAASPNDILQPMVVVASGDGRRAYVGNAAGHSISVVDLTTWQARRPIVIPTADDAGAAQFGSDVSLIDLALTPTGDRLYAAVLAVDKANQERGVAGLFYLTLGLPEEWTLTQGYVMPLTLAEPHRLAALFGPLTAEECAAQPPRPSSLSQAVAASGGRVYEFSFWGIALSAGATAEVIWRGDACALQHTDRVPVQIDEDAAIRPCPAIDPAAPDTWPELLLHRVRLEAPAGATQAEIRFISPPGKNMLIDTVSFLATAETTVNGDLLQVDENGEVVGWQLAPATAVGISLSPAPDGLRVGNTGSATASLLQSFAATAAQPFLLRFEGQIAAVGAGGPPRVELRWLDAAGAPTGEVAALALQPDQTVHQLQGVAPTNAAGAELHLVLPGGAALVVRHVSYAPVEMATVPICFVAEAPGDIAVLGFDYAYDTPAARPAPAPPAGLCAPTPPGRRPDGKSGCMCAYCATPCGPCCDEEDGDDHAAAPAAAGLRSARPRRATQPARATRPLIRAQGEAPESLVVPRLLPVEDDLRGFLALPAPAWAERAPELAAAAAPLTLVNGIGPGRAAVLRQLGLGALPALAAADPQAIAVALNGVSPAMASGFVTEARTLLANPVGLPAPLVSCIMPTANHRDRVPQAIALFRRQTYPHRELIIIDDGEDSVADLIPDEATLRAEGAAIRYVRLDGRRTLGQKRNFGGEAAQGPIIAHWDDTTWYAPWRLSYQLGALVQREADGCGLDSLLQYDPAAGTAWLSGPEPALFGGTLCYRRALWLARPFEESDDSDAAFLRDRPDARLIALPAIDWLVGILLLSEESRPAARARRPYPAREVRRLLGDDAAIYERLAGRAPAPVG